MKMLFISAVLATSALACGGNANETGSQAALNQTGSTQERVAMDPALNPPGVDNSAIKKYLAEQGVSDFKELESGLIYTVEDVGEGAELQSGQHVVVHCRGVMLESNQTFFDTWDLGEPFSFTLGRDPLIQAWAEGIPLFNVGGKGRLYAPSALGYGERGHPGVGIPPNTDLYFDIEVLAIKSQAELEAEAQQAVAQARIQNEKDILAYIAANGLKAERTESGLFYVIESPGSGPLAAQGNTVSVHYTGRLLDGTTFDSSEGGEPYTFRLGVDPVVQGWTEGLKLFKQGGKGKFLIPASLGYGLRGRAPIPPNAVMVFDIELVSVVQ